MVNLMDSEGNLVWIPKVLVLDGLDQVNCTDMRRIRIIRKDFIKKDNKHKIVYYIMIGW